MGKDKSVAEKKLDVPTDDDDSEFLPDLRDWCFGPGTVKLGYGTERDLGRLCGIIALLSES